MSGYLLVRAGGSHYGLPLADVIEVVDDVRAESVPGMRAAVRGIARLRGRAIPVVHLAALLREQPLPQTPGHTVVVARCRGKAVALEVDDADEVVRGTTLPLPAGQRFPWAVGVADRRGMLVPIVDLTAISDRLTIGEAATRTDER